MKTIKDPNNMFGDPNSPDRHLSASDGMELAPGSNNYRAYVGPPDRFDFMGATQFSLLFQMGLRDHHSVLDFGCGSLRLGRLLIPFLQKGGYHGIDPNSWLIKDGMERELGKDIDAIKSPRFSHNTDFNCDVFDEKFDFIIAQSIITHTGLDYFYTFLETAKNALKPNGVVLFTYLPNVNDDDPLPANGWHYPECVNFDLNTVEDLAAKAGLAGKVIPWHHVVTRWYCAALSEDQLPVDQHLKHLTGSVLRSDQFVDSVERDKTTEVLELNKNVKTINKTPRPEVLALDSQGLSVNASCGICGQNYPMKMNLDSREGQLCSNCGASGRSQAIAYCLSHYIFKENKPLTALKRQRKLKIVGLSDGNDYALPLAKKCNYTNTYYHTKPYLDITDPPENFKGVFDALISADVFEHVLAEPDAAFKGAYDVLKPGGAMILSVPFVNEGEHQEHYPGLANYTSEQRADGTWIANLEYADGRREVDEAPCFHGGPGKTLELRLFNRDRLEKEILAAGFKAFTVLDDNILYRGINWNPCSRVIIAHK